MYSYNLAFSIYRKIVSKVNIKVSLVGYTRFTERRKR